MILLPVSRLYILQMQNVIKCDVVKIQLNNKDWNKTILLTWQFDEDSIVWLSGASGPPCYGSHQSVACSDQRCPDVSLASDDHKYQYEGQFWGPQVSSIKPGGVARADEVTPGIAVRLRKNLSGDGDQALGEGPHQRRNPPAHQLYSPGHLGVLTCQAQLAVAVPQGAVQHQQGHALTGVNYYLPHSNNLRAPALSHT